MSMKYNRIAVLVGAGAALVIMTALSCAFGYILPQLIPKFYTQLIATILFFVFGFKLLYDWKYGEESHEEEEVEVEMQNLHQKFTNQSEKENQGNANGQQQVESKEGHR